MHTYISLRNDLEKLGIPQDGTLLIHSSMKSIGDVEGRADTVLDVFMDYFKEAGLLVFPTLTWSNVNAEQPVFNVRETPSVVGILPQLFRQRPGVIRSLHPTHSLARCAKAVLATRIVSFWMRRKSRITRWKCSLNIPRRSTENGWMSIRGSSRNI